MNHASGVFLAFQPTARAVSIAERLKNIFILSISLSYGPYTMLRKSFFFPQNRPYLYFTKNALTSGHLLATSPKGLRHRANAGYLESTAILNILLSCGPYTMLRKSFFFFKINHAPIYFYGACFWPFSQLTISKCLEVKTFKGFLMILFYVH